MDNRVDGDNFVDQEAAAVAELVEPEVDEEEADPDFDSDLEAESDPGLDLPFEPVSDLSLEPASDLPLEPDSAPLLA
ncbi:MAG: hypothetical protein ACRDTJ_15015, partial [Pseudonocardiaceae bacterium]